MRLFIQFHDMAHFSFFKSARLNKFFGKIIGIYAHYPFDQWRNRHNGHHDSFGNLDLKDPQSALLTYSQYENSSFIQKVFIRILR